MMAFNSSICSTGRSECLGLSLGLVKSPKSRCVTSAYSTVPVLFDLLLPDEEPLDEDEDEAAEPEDEADPRPGKRRGHQGVGLSGLELGENVLVFFIQETFTQIEVV